MDEENKSRLTEWLDKILKEKNFNILKYDFTSIKFTEGHVSRIKCNVRATVRKNGKTEILDLFVKDNEGTIGIFSDGQHNEINVYSKLVPYFNADAEEYETDPIETIPLCYGASYAGLREMVVLENLKSRGFKKRELVPLDLNHIKLVLKAFAEWHAHGFALEYRDVDVFDQIKKPNMGFGKIQTLNRVVTSYEKELDIAIGLYEKKNKPTVLEKLKSLRKNLRVMFMKKYLYVCNDYKVITHAQAWNDNFMFKYDEESTPTEVRIIDWQTSILGSPLIDVAQVLFWCCSREDLENIHDLLEIYHSILSKKIRQLRGKPEDINICFSWKGCLSSFRKYASLAIAGVPFIMRMQFKDGLKATAEGPKHFSSFDQEAYFERMNSILEFCIENNFI